MSGISYSRTGGTGILTGTWQAVQARYPGQQISPDERLSWDEASGPDQAKVSQFIADQVPPVFLRFDLADSAFALDPYPGAVNAAAGRPGDGYLQGMNEVQAAAFLGIPPAQIARELAKFHGPVTAVSVPAGTTIYRTVGLTARSAKYGVVVNNPLGAWWELRCPSDYACVEDWRAATAVKAEWNGDWGYVALRLPTDLHALQGEVGMQMVDGTRNLALPGGGQQLFVPDLKGRLSRDIGAWDAKQLMTLIHETRFGAGAPAPPAGAGGIP